METRKLGNSDMEITRIGVGAWAMGGGNWLFGWGDQDDQESIDAIHRAVELGINWIDTAAVYGAGHSEAVVGKALKGLTNKPYIFTKGTRYAGDDGKMFSIFDAADVKQECEDSLRRLDVDVIDLYQIHWPAPDSNFDEAWQAMTELQQEGKVRYIGVSNFSVEQMQKIQPIAPITSLQPPYSMINRAIEDSILPFVEQEDLGVIVYSPMQSGLLTGKMTQERMANLPENDWRHRNPHFQEPNLTRNLSLVGDVLKPIAAAQDVTIAEVAINWTLNHSAVTAAIVGARRPDQVDGVVHAADFRLSDDELKQIDSFLAANPV